MNRNHVTKENDIAIKNWKQTFDKVFNELKYSRGDSLNLHNMLANLPADANVKNILQGELLFALTA
jgi:hypothetical protein